MRNSSPSRTSIPYFVNANNVHSHSSNFLSTEDSRPENFFDHAETISICENTFDAHSYLNTMSPPKLKNITPISSNSLNEVSYQIY